MATITASAAGGKWSEVKAWSPEQVPTAADDVILASTSGSIKIEAEAKCRSLDATNYTQTLSGNKELVIGTSTSNGGLALKLGASMTFSLSGTVKFVSTSGTEEGITTAGKQPAIVTLAGVGGKWKLVDKLSWTSILSCQSGELKTNGQELVGESIQASESTTFVLNLGTSIVKLSGTGVNFCVLTGSGLTVEATSSTIELTDASETAKSFKGGGHTFGIVVVATDNLTIVSSNTFAKLQVNTKGKSAKGTLIEKGTTQTITESFTTNSTAAETIKLKSSEAGKAWKLKKSAGAVETTGVELQDSTAEGGAAFIDRGVGGTDKGNNTGWLFDEDFLFATHVAGAVSDLGSRF